MPTTILSITILISAITAIYFKYRAGVKTYGVFKLLTTALLILMAIGIYHEQQTTYSLLMIVSLGFSLIGDLFLIDKKYFLYGLFSFLLAHICFTIAFAGIAGFNGFITPLLVLVLIGGMYFIYLRQNLHKYTIPVAIYLVVIVVMNWQAIGLSLIEPNIAYLGIAIASLFFSFSDAVIAYNKFKKPFELAEILILSTYWTALYIFTIAGLYV